MWVQGIQAEATLVGDYPVGKVCIILRRILVLDITQIEREWIDGIYSLLLVGSKFSSGKGEGRSVITNRPIKCVAFCQITSLRVPDFQISKSAQALSVDCVE